MITRESSPTEVAVILRPFKLTFSKSNGKLLLEILLFPGFLFALPRFARVLFAILGGTVLGRPISGLWLAKFFLGRGGSVKLPSSLIKTIKKALENYHNIKIHTRLFIQEENIKPNSLGWFAEQIFLLQNERYVVVRGFEISPEVYSTIGDFVLRAKSPAFTWSEFIRAENYQLIDVYNWQGTANWHVYRTFGKIKVIVKGIDLVWQNIGVIFITFGEINISENMMREIVKSSCFG